VPATPGKLDQTLAPVIAKLVRDGLVPASHCTNKDNAPPLHNFTARKHARNRAALKYQHACKEQQAPLDTQRSFE